MSDDLPKRPSRRWLIYGGILTTVLIALFTLPCSIGVLPARTMAISKLMPLGRALIEYSKDNNGQLPPVLSALTPDYIATEVFARIRFRDPDSKHQFDWLYFPRQTLSGLPPDTILAAAPATLSPSGTPQKRIVFLSNGTVTEVAESDFNRLLQEQHVTKPK